MLIPTRLSVRLLRTNIFTFSPVTALHWANFPRLLSRASVCWEALLPPRSEALGIRLCIDIYLPLTPGSKTSAKLSNSQALLSGLSSTQRDFSLLATGDYPVYHNAIERPQFATNAALTAEGTAATCSTARSVPATGNRRLSRSQTGISIKKSGLCAQIFNQGKLSCQTNILPELFTLPPPNSF